MSCMRRFVSALIFVTLASGCGSVHERSTPDGGRTSSGGNGGSNPSADGGDVPLAQAALTFSVAPASGKTCSHTTPQLSLPSKYNASVQAELACDLSTGCKPDDYVVVAGSARLTTVACSVVAAAGGYDVQLFLSVDGSATNEVSAEFNLNGEVTQTGGTVSVNERTTANNGGAESDCTLKINPPSGVVKPGAIWGSIDCPHFGNPTDIGDTGCHLQGEFLFEDCAAH
jgi:hypothetical protein